MNDQKILFLMISFGIYLVLGLVSIPTIGKVQALRSSPDPTTDFSDDINGIYNQLKYDKDKVTDSVSHARDKVPGGHDSSGVFDIRFCDPSGFDFVIPSCAS